MTATPTIKIKVGGVELSCSGPVDRDQLADVLATIQEAVPEWVAQPATSAQGPTAAQLLAESAAKTFGDKAGVIAWWLEHYQGRGEWRTGDILQVLRDIGEPEPANLTDALNQKVKKGLFEVQDRRWKLTGEGRGWVKYALLRSDGA